MKTLTGQTNIFEEKECRAQKITMFMVKDVILTSESEIRGTSEFFSPPKTRRNVSRPPPFSINNEAYLIPPLS